MRPRLISRSWTVLSALMPAFAVALLCAGAASAQTPALGDVARKEAERRKGQSSAGKVYTNKDLPPAAQKPAASAAPDGQVPLAADPVAAATEQKPEEKPQDEPKNEAWWKNRMAAAREELRRNEVFAEALQSRINALSRDFVNRDNPVHRANIGKERTEALNELARVKQEIERSRKQIQDIEEEARTAGIPPGWVR